MRVTFAFNWAADWFLQYASSRDTALQALDPCNQRLMLAGPLSTSEVPRDLRHIYSRLVVCLPLVLTMAPSHAVWASAPSPSSTRLTISPPSAEHAHVSLTATVTSNGKPVAPGLVVFCRATAKYCEDTAVLGQAQLTSAGTATLNLILPVGNYNIKAIFQGTNVVAGSSSATRDATVIGKFAQPPR